MSDPKVAATQKSAGAEISIKVAMNGFVVTVLGANMETRIFDNFSDATKWLQEKLALS